ncbi:Na+/H+ antiporter subunit E [Tepidibacter aestuarii]|uniref:Na+/H+ antiporter subunit E n=1 Tax=Tepidibacter aestuarii TaxID=2925782 RepID=UPI0020BF3AFD|nr:Na+/H+ antiporter subunit E [Tepidibacter aestuarii]CAH2212558.1 Multicomponent Na+:H+ antiporter subunit E [Tepidibacter aestuarii]
MFRKCIYIIQYLFVLIVEVVKANIDVAVIVLSRKIEVDPVVVNFKTKLKSDLCRVILANSITLTPGTMTMIMEKDIYTIHCLKKQFADGLSDSKFENILLKIEEI